MLPVDPLVVPTNSATHSYSRKPNAEHKHHPRLSRGVAFETWTRLALDSEACVPPSGFKTGQKVCCRRRKAVFRCHGHPDDGSLAEPNRRATDPVSRAAQGVAPLRLGRWSRQRDSICTAPRARSTNLFASTRLQIKANSGQRGSLPQ